MAFFATFALIIVLVFRPQEIWPVLNAFRLLDVFTGLAALGVGIDFALRKQKHPYSPQLPFLAGFLACAYFTTALYVGRQGITLATTRAVIAAVFMLAVTYGARTPERLRSLVGLLVALAVVVGAIAIHQGRSEPLCLEIPAVTDVAREDDDFSGEPDGRTCETRADCTKGGRGDVDYECERLGMFNTVTVERRVRWRGQLGDPNELSVFLGAVIPFLLAAFSVAKGWPGKGLSLALIGVLLYAIILTQSRGGQLVVAVVFAVYFAMRFGVKGVIAAGVLAAPVILLGGRSDANADASADERQGILYDAITSFIHRPFGQGIDQFTEDHRLTAHNAYMLAAVDLGMLGFLAWSGMIWASLKIPIAIVRRPPANLDPRLRALAVALTVSLIGVSIGIFFLSFTYKQLLFVWLGLAGALYGAVKNDDPEFEVNIGFKDVLGVFVADLVLLGVIFLFTRLNPK
ncbi:MAG: putative exopolysaccharide production protein, partial [Labilithrix sp.]|nr:putative exopolysaccharide production protein [Labilithrix sp.]